MQHPGAPGGGSAGLSPHHFTIAVAADHPAFAGHFPGHPVLPGVVLLAEVLAGVEAGLGLPMDRIQIRSAKFHAPVLPGSTLTVELVPGSVIGFTISCGSTRVASGSIAPEPALPSSAGDAS
jgi:3-hydroxyacyl-[acyl-carrier-protein] dehydratase